MKRPELPQLAETGRRYVEDTMRARLRGPGVERFRTRRGPTTGAMAVAAALVAVAALVGAMVYLVG